MHLRFLTSFLTALASVVTASSFRTIQVNNLTYIVNEDAENLKAVFNSSTSDNDPDHIIQLLQSCADNPKILDGYASKTNLLLSKAEEATFSNYTLPKILSFGDEHNTKKDFGYPLSVLKLSKAVKRVLFQTACNNYGVRKFVLSLPASPTASEVTRELAFHFRNVMEFYKKENNIDMINLTNRYAKLGLVAAYYGVPAARDFNWDFLTLPVNFDRSVIPDNVRDSPFKPPQKPRPVQILSPMPASSSSSTSVQYYGFIISLLILLYLQ